MSVSLGAFRSAALKAIKQRSSRLYDAEHDLRVVFDSFDFDASGYITAAKIRRVMTCLEKDIFDRDVSSMSTITSLFFRPASLSRR